MHQGSIPWRLQACLVGMPRQHFPVHDQAESWLSASCASELLAAWQCPCNCCHQWYPAVHLFQPQSLRLWAKPSLTQQPSIAGFIKAGWPCQSILPPKS